MIVREDADRRLERIIAGLQTCDFLLPPQYLALPRQLERLVLGGDDAPNAHAEFFAKHVSGGIARGLAVNAFPLGIGIEAESLQATDVMALDLHGAVFGDLRVKFVLLLEPPHQRARAPIDEALGQTLV